jgi:short subunit dehydrogenase-like uncharacterized protein
MQSAERKGFLIYGAYGYTGALIARLAAAKGYRPLLAGRDETKLRTLAGELRLPYLAFSLSDEEKLNTALREVGTVLHCAGPFSKTARLMVFACLRNKVNYLDITGELDVFEWIASRDAQAKKAGITLLPGVGFDVVPSDCLATYLKNELPDAQTLELAFAGLSRVSRGTALTMLENADKGGVIRKDGILKEVPIGYYTRKIPFPSGLLTGVSIRWGDVSTAYYSTGISTITAYIAAAGPTAALLKTSRYLKWLYKASPVKKFLAQQVYAKVSGPDQQFREHERCYLWGEVRNPQGQILTAYLETPEAYHLTAQTALMAAVRMSEQTVAPGFMTPSLAFGPDFILEVPGVTRTPVR